MAGAASFAAKSGAQEYTSLTLDWIRMGRSFRSQSGQLEQSVTWRATRAGALVSANAEHGPFVEYGTAPHVIRPKAGRKALKIPVPGGYVLVKKVNHPGTKPLPFFFADRVHREARVLRVMEDAFVSRMNVRAR